MPNTQKLEIVESLTQKFKDSSGIYFTKYTGMNVAQATELRRCFREESVHFLVSKNTLTKIAARNAGFEDKLDAVIKGQIAIAWSVNDPTSPAKAIKKFSSGDKSNKDVLEVLGLLFEGVLYDPEKYKEIADLPSKDELLAKLLSALSQPMTTFAQTLNGSMSKLAQTLASLKNKKS
tara:strand:- start:719 stop:1249 length:531 start_codon:yes stop_codon:yes gene_type:complete